MDANGEGDDDGSHAEFLRSTSNDEDGLVTSDGGVGPAIDDQGPTEESPAGVRDGDGSDGHAVRSVAGANAVGAAADSSTSTPAAAAAVAAAPPSDDSPGKRGFTVPEPPRWRFVNEAKKTSGYSSVAAGRFVEGLSAEELAAKYASPEWQVEKENAVENVKMTAAEMEEEAEREEKELRRVGRLNIREGQAETEETFEGTFGGFRRKTPLGDGEGSEEGAGELATLEGETLDPPLVLPPEVSALRHYLELQAEQGVVKSSTSRSACTPGMASYTEGMGGARAPDGLEAAAVEATPAKDSDSERAEKPAELTPAIAEPAASAAEDEPLEKGEMPPKKNRKRCLLLLLLPLVVLAAVLGALLGREDGSEGEENANRAIDGATVIGDERNETDAPTSSPSSSPLATTSSAAPSEASEASTTALSESLPLCPTGAKLLAVQSDANNNDEEGAGIRTSYTWAVKDACTGEEAMGCLPCPRHPSTPSSFDDEAAAAANSTTTTRQLTRRLGVIDPQCVGPAERPRPLRDGERFRFNLLGTDARCADGRGSLYEWGLFDDVDNFNDCAHACVVDTPAQLVRRSDFRGCDYDCESRSCRCLYDQDTLNELNSLGFDGTSREDHAGTDAVWGAGEIAGTAGGNPGYYCGKLVSEDVPYLPTHAPAEEWKAPESPMDEEDAGAEEYATSRDGDGARGCLPDDKDYVFEVKPSDGAGACCGFDPRSFVVTYDRIVVERGEKYTNNIFDDVDGGNADPSEKTRIVFGQRAVSCPSSNPSSAPSAVPSRTDTAPPPSSPLPPFTPSPLPSLLDIPDTTIPCREVIEAELVGRINGLSRPFCGLCEWKRSGFNCYQRIAHLKRVYGTGRLEAREGLLNQGHCKVPAETEDNTRLNEYLQREIEKIPYCGNAADLPTMRVLVPSPSPTIVPTTDEPTPTDLTYEPTHLRPNSHRRIQSRTFRRGVLPIGQRQLRPANNRQVQRSGP